MAYLHADDSGRLNRILSRFVVIELIGLERFIYKSVSEDSDRLRGVCMYVQYKRPFKSVLPNIANLISKAWWILPDKDLHACFVILTLPWWRIVRRIWRRLSIFFIRF